MRIRQKRIGLRGTPCVAHNHFQWNHNACYCDRYLREIETDSLHHKNELAIVSGVLTLLVFLERLSSC